MSAKEVTNLVEIGSLYEEMLPVTKCVCGAQFGAWWDKAPFFDINTCVFDPDIHHCPKCGRGLYFSVDIHVYEIGAASNDNGA